MKRKPQIIIGIILIVIFVLLAVAAPLLAPNDPNATDLALKNAPPSAEYPLGCDQMVAFNSVINSSFLVLVPTALIIGLVSSDLVGFTQSFLFYVIFSPACAVMLNKILYMTKHILLLMKKVQIEELSLLKNYADFHYHSSVKKTYLI